MTDDYGNTIAGEEPPGASYLDQQSTPDLAKQPPVPAVRRMEESSYAAAS